MKVSSSNGIIFRKIKIIRSFLNPGCTAEATVAEFPPCIAEVEVILLLSPAVGDGGDAAKQ